MRWQATLLLIPGVSTTEINGRFYHARYFAANQQTKLFVYAETLTGEPRPAQDDVTAAQLWPSSRAAASFVARYVADQASQLTVCGLGAPSIAASFAGAQAIATDIDKQSLACVEEAAKHQGLFVETRVFDLCNINSKLPVADMYVLADVVGGNELSAAVASRTIEALDSRSLVVVALEFDRPQKQDLLRRLSEVRPDMAIPKFEPAWFWTKARAEGALHHLIALEVDETDSTLYT